MVRKISKQVWIEAHEAWWRAGLDDSVKSTVWCSMMDMLVKLNLTGDINEVVMEHRHVWVDVIINDLHNEWKIKNVL